MLSRRTFIKSIFAGYVLGGARLAANAAVPTSFEGKDVFARIMQKVQGWSSLPIGNLMGKIAKELEGTPYKPGTLELSSVLEICSVNLKGLDCVTFFETTLDFARMIKKGGETPEALLKEIAFTRYRGGVVGDYTSRLHYTSDWLYDNQAKKTVRMLDDLPGAENYSPKVSFMSDHPDSYAQLVMNPRLVDQIKQQEALINSRSMKFIPIDKISGVESSLKTGDIVGVCTSTPGLDITHTGLVVCDDNGVPHFMHASSTKSNYKVLVKPGPMSAALAWAKTNTGAIFARPLEP